METGGAARELRVFLPCGVPRWAAKFSGVGSPMQMCAGVSEGVAPV